MTDGLGGYSVEEPENSILLDQVNPSKSPAKPSGSNSGIGMGDMVNWYKHDIPAWMDETESLSDGAYRVLHVVSQLIYLNEGPIRLNENGIAGRCNMHVLAFRKYLNELVTSGRLLRNPDHTLAQPRAHLELERIGRNRVNAGLGGRARAKSLENHTSNVAPLKLVSAHKTREEERREENKDAAPAAVGENINIKTPDAELFAKGRDILGKSAGGLIKRLLDAKGGNIPQAMSALYEASTKDNPREYIGGVINRKTYVPAGRAPDRPGMVWGDDYM